ncbi:putative non-specific serine/threonine protein kinase [Helianthus annuus]|nr:putative non-specific serine/threonine protein kinase [Helianthus annuus]
MALFVLTSNMPIKYSTKSQSEPWVPSVPNAIHRQQWIVPGIKLIRFRVRVDPNSDVTSFTLVIIHIASSRIIWSANRDVPVVNSDKFVFDNDGNAYLQGNGKVVWSTNTGKKGVSAIELLDSGNLVLVNNDGGVVWQSFNYPTNTLMPDQDFIKGMKLVSNRDNNMSFRYN